MRLNWSAATGRTTTPILRSVSSTNSRGSRIPRTVGGQSRPCARFSTITPNPATLGRNGSASDPTGSVLPVVAGASGGSRSSTVPGPDGDARDRRLAWMRPRVPGCLGRQIGREPAASHGRDLFESARLLELVRGTRNDLDAAVAGDRGLCPAI